jgi:hypothetical protein
MSLACQEVSGNELAGQKGDSPEDRRKQIFRLYVEQMFLRKGTTALFSKEKIIGWLSWLAGKMQEQWRSVFIVEALQPNWLGTPKRVAYGTVVLLTFRVDLLAGWRVDLWAARRAVLHVGLGLIFGVLPEWVGVLTESIFGLTTPGPFVELILWNELSGFLVKSGKAAPNKGIKLLLQISLGVFLIVWLTVWLVIWPLVGLRAGLFTGLIFGLTAGGSIVIRHYELRLTLWLNGYTPFNFIKFLDHCAKLILLKKVGGGYIFIHRMLLDYFADLNPKSTAIDKGKTAQVPVSER